MERGLVSKVLINVDKGCDYVPFVSTATNLVDLIIKVAFEIFSLIDEEASKRFEDNFSYIKYLHQKEFAICALFCIPFLNTFLAIPYHKDRRLNSAASHTTQRQVEELERTRETIVKQKKRLKESIETNTLVDDKVRNLIALHRLVNKPR